MSDQDIRNFIHDVYKEYLVYQIDENLEEDTNIEFELRFGSFDPIRRRYVNGVSTAAAFDRVKKYCIERKRIYDFEKSNRTIESMNYDDEDGNRGIIRKVTTSYDNKSEEVIYQYKSSLYSKDKAIYGIRSDISQETTDLELSVGFEVETTRNNTRYSYKYGNYYTIDLTIEQIGEEENLVYDYQVELEFGTEKTKESIEIFKKVAIDIYKRIHKTKIIYSLKEKYDVIRGFNNLLGGKSSYSIDKNAITHARPIKFRDIVWGGLIGNNKTNYRISFKADGDRVFFFIFNGSIWLLSGSQDVNCIFNLSDGMTQTRFENTILDCELIPNSNRLKDAPKHDFWFIVLDALRIEEIDIRDDRHNDRMLKAQTFIDHFNNNYIHFNTKSYGNIGSVEDLFNNVKKFEVLKQRGEQKYKTDGYVFVPDKSSYVELVDGENPNFIELYKRKLSSITEIVKWKPVEQITIDLKVIKNDEGEVTQLLTSRIAKNSFIYIPFEGTDIQKFKIETDLERNNDVLIDSINGSVVEFGYKDGKLHAERIRHNKVYPNMENIVKDNWSDIFDPIKIEYLTGHDIRFMRKYHNKAKRALIRSARMHLGPNKNILDIGSGRGGDVSSMSRNFGKLILVEPDTKNTIVLIQRILQLGIGHRILIHSNNSKELLKGVDDKKNEHKIVFIKNFKRNYFPNDSIIILQTGGEDNKLIKEACLGFFNGTADVISMMFSMSFFWKSEEMVKKLSVTIKENLKAGGSFIFTTINGNAVQQYYEPVFNSYIKKTIMCGTQDNPEKVFNSKLVDLDQYNMLIEFVTNNNKNNKNNKNNNNNNNNNKQLKIYIKDTIVSREKDEFQTEWLVDIDDLLENLGDKFKKVAFKRLENEQVMTKIEYYYSKFMYAGIFKKTGFQKDMEKEEIEEYRPTKNKRIEKIKPIGTHKVTYKTYKGPFKSIKNKLNKCNEIIITDLDEEDKKYKDFKNKALGTLVSIQKDLNIKEIEESKITFDLNNIIYPEKK